MDTNEKAVQNRFLDQFRGNSKREEKPVENEIKDHVVPRWASSWRKLGMQLKMEEDLLQNIEKDNANDCEECCNKMLIEWLAMDRNTSWETLLDALDKLNTEPTSFDETSSKQQQQNQQLPSSDQPSLPKNPLTSSQPSNEDSGQNEVHHESMLKSGPLIKLKGNYIKVVNKIKHIIASKQFEIEDLIEKLCLAHESYAFSTDNTVTKVATINELFFHINKYCNIYDYELLREFLVSLDECDEAVKLLDDFTEELHHSVLKELDLMSESKDQLKPKIPMNGTCTLRIKYTGDKCTLSTKNMVQRIIYESLKLHKQSIVFIGLEEGCIVFVYQISANVKSYILQNKITPDGIRLLASHDIKCLIVDGTEIPIPLEFIFKTQVDELIANMSTEEQVATLSTLNRIFDNVIQYPNDDKYHQIKLSGKTFDNKVWQYSSGKRLMKTSGWVVENDHVKLKDSSSVPNALTVISLKLKDTKFRQLAIQLDKFFTSLNPGDCKEALVTIQTCFKNINLHPRDEKYRQIKLNNRTFYSKVWQYPVGEEFMKMSGWEVEDVSIKLKNDSCIETVLQLLKEKLESSLITWAPQELLTITQFEALTSAILTKNIAETRKLLQCCGISSAGRVFCEDGSSINLLFAAVITHQCNIVQLLVKCYNVNPHVVDPHVSHQKPCIFHIFHQQPENFIIQFLSSVCINVCAKVDGLTVLHTAVLTNCLEVLSLLFLKDRRYSKTTCLNHTDNERRNSLHLAYLYGNTEMAALLLENGVDETAIDIYGKTPFDYIDGDPKLIAYAQHVQSTRKIHSNPFSIEYNHYIKLLDHGIDPEEATFLTMKEFNWLQKEGPTPPRPHVDQAIILKDLAHFLVTRPCSS